VIEAAAPAEVQASSEVSAQPQKEESQPAAEAQMSSQSYETTGEVLLDLGDFRQSQSVLDDDFVLDIDLDEIPEPSPAEPAFSAAAFRGRESYRTLPKIQSSYAASYAAPTTISSEPVATTEELAPAPRFQRVFADEAAAPAAPVAAAPPAYAAPAPLSAAELSPEMIDAIARRAVEQLSEKVVQEIAWEVVPQLAELLIKRQLEEKNS
jgi:hypothetical protein